MRVLESKLPALQVTMGKRKHKLRKQKKEAEGFGSESSDEGTNTGRGCPHLTKAVNLSAVRKALKQNPAIGECGECGSPGESSSVSVADTVSGSQGAVGGLDGGKATEDALLEGMEVTVWLCLQCAHQGCDRNSEAKHAMKHYQTPRSASHALVVNVNTWQVWCYDCDDEVLPESNGKLQECVEFVRKQAGLAPKTDAQASQVKRSSSLRSAAEASGAGGSSEMGSSSGIAQASESNVGGLGGGKELKRPRSGGSSQVCQSLTQALPKVRGLNNLGNTCFFNAVMQNLSQTQVLEAVLGEQVKKEVCLKLPGRSAVSPYEEEEEEDGDSGGGGGSSDEESGHAMELEPLTLVLGESGALTQSMLSFLRDMNGSSRNSTISPSALFGQVCRKAPRFKGFQQQDSHELLRHLLDGMKAEEIRRHQHSILKEFNLSENASRKKVADDTRIKVKEYGRQAKHTFVDIVFGGHFISTVLCEDCKTPSQIFEPFLDISLPITEEKTVRPNSQWGARGKKEAATEAATSNKTKVTAAPSKHTNKKAKKQAKKEAKRKGKGSGKRGKREENEEEEMNVGSEGEEAAGEEEEEAKDAAPSKPAEENNCEGKKRTSEEENMSDADIEDNIESDVSRTRTQLPHKLQELDNGFPLPVGKHKNECSMESRSGHGSSSEDSTLKGSLGTTSSDISSSRTKVDTESSEGRSICSSETIESLCGSSRSTEHKGSISSLELVSDGMRTMHIQDPAEDSGITNCNHVESSSSRPPDTDSERSVQGHTTTAGSSRRGSESISRAQLRREASLRAMTSLAPRYQAVSHECSVMSCLNQFTAAELLTGNNKFGCGVCTRQKHLKQGKQGKRELVLSNASKQLLVLAPPPVLTLHLKRFQQVGFSLRKVNRHVEFPMLLDLAPYCSALCQSLQCGSVFQDIGRGQSRVLYSLYGVVEHSGRLSGGHYTAYVKVRPKSPKHLDFIKNPNPATFKIDRLVDTLQQWTEGKEEPSANEASAGEDNGQDVAPPPGKWYYISDSRVSEVTHESNVLRCQAYLLFYERIY